LNYALVVPVTAASELGGISRTNCWVLSRHQQALAPLLPKNRIQLDGMSDLTIDGKKFSGNAQRRLKKSVLMHGTFLYGFELEKISRYLKLPFQQPAYRNQRPHAEFVTNLPLSRQQIESAISACWNAVEPGLIPPDEEITRLAQTRANKP
jgi:lipoate-protein ligase A